MSEFTDEHAQVLKTIQEFNEPGDPIVDGQDFRECLDAGWVEAVSGQGFIVTGAGKAEWADHEKAKKRK